MSNRDPFKRRARPNENWNRLLGAVNEAVHRPNKAKPYAAALENRLQHIADEGWNARHHSRYRRVKVFLTYWAETDNCRLGVEKAARKLADVFSRLYHFDVQIWLIPSIDRPQHFLKSNLERFVQVYGDEGNLLIFWYCGLARRPEDGKGAGIWFGEYWGGTINSGIVPQILASGKADVLTLYDCEYSLHGHSVSAERLFEHLGASSMGSVIDFNNIGSFTRSLVQILGRPETAAYGLSVADIHRKMVNLALRHCGGSFLAEDTMNVRLVGPMAARSQHVEDAPVYPVYCHLSACPSRSSGKPSSIILSHLGYPLDVFPSENHDEEVQVRLKLTLQSKANTERWKEWILSAPPEVKRVSVQVE
ncbi:hypothetical protein SCAR479_03474 [Seiridium cardinale]|uniref:Uncharacterized protein n=1 Tax=Seiridium cardinale TaxID=138064 RepID=A0ABR2Y1C9_9PEZI